MKDQAIQYLALDVHKATTTATDRDDAGTIRLRMTVPTTAQNLLSVVRAAGRRVHVAFEEGTQAQWVHDVLQRTSSASWCGVQESWVATRTIASTPIGSPSCCAPAC